MKLKEIELFSELEEQIRDFEEGKIYPNEAMNGTIFQCPVCLHTCICHHKLEFQAYCMGDNGWPPYFSVCTSVKALLTQDKAVNKNTTYLRRKHEPVLMIREWPWLNTESE